MIAMTDPRRSALQPDIPTMAEAGLPDFYRALLGAIFVPRATPAAVVARFNADHPGAVADEALREPGSLALGVEPRASMPEGARPRSSSSDFAFLGALWSAPRTSTL